MIDYQKLKLAHELADKLKLSYIMTLRNHGHLFPSYDIKLEYNYNAESNSFSEIIEHKDLNAIIQKLTELTQTNPKYAVGQEVWMLDTLSGLRKAQIISISSNVKLTGAISYKVKQEDGGQTTCWEKGIFPTKQALIEAQIEYWKSLLTCPAEDCYYQNNECGHIPQEKSTQHEDMSNKSRFYVPNRKCENCNKIIFGDYECPCLSQMGRLPFLNFFALNAGSFTDDMVLVATLCISNC